MHNGAYKKKCVRAGVTLSHRRLVRHLHRRGHKSHKTPHTSVLESSNLHRFEGGRGGEIRKLRRARQKGNS